MVCRAQIIVLQKLRSFFSFSGPKLSYNYRIIVHLATLFFIDIEPCSTRKQLRATLAAELQAATVKSAAAEQAAAAHQCVQIQNAK